MVTFGTKITSPLEYRSNFNGNFLEMNIFPILFSLVKTQVLEKLYSPHGGPRHLFTISLKDSHLFKIAESVINFCLKKIPNSAILNRWEYFSGIVDHVTCPPWEPYNFFKSLESVVIWSKHKSPLPSSNISKSNFSSVKNGKTQVPRGFLFDWSKKPKSPW